MINYSDQHEKLGKAVHFVILTIGRNLNDIIVFAYTRFFALLEMTWFFDYDILHYFPKKHLFYIFSKKHLCAKRTYFL